MVHAHLEEILPTILYCYVQRATQPKGERSAVELTHLGTHGVVAEVAVEFARLKIREPGLI